MKNWVSFLRLLALLEGLSLLSLLFVAMPLKYMHGVTTAVPMVGMTHGILFLVFVAFALIVSQKRAWSDRFLLLLLASSLVPFGNFMIDRKLRVHT